MRTKRQEKLSSEKMHPTLFPANIHFPSFQGTLISVNWQHAHMGTIRERQQPIISRIYILCGWMTEEDAKAFQNDISGDSRIFCLIDENEQEDAHKTPPTKLKNPKLFKPFEMYTKMYGLPAYGEMDPTWFIAITYSFIFGAMFGDAGQGLVLLIGGYLLYRFKHIDLAGICLNL